MQVSHRTTGASPCGVVAAGQQRPLPVILRQPVDFGVACQVQNQTITAVGFGAQAASHHLQIEREAHCGPGDDHAGSVGQVEPLGGDGNVDQDAEGSIAKGLDGPGPVVRRCVAEQYVRRYVSLVEHRRQVAGVVLGDGVYDSLAFGGVELPEAQRACGHKHRGDLGWPVRFLIRSIRRRR